MFKYTARQAVSGARTYSSQASKAQSTLTSLLEKGSALTRTGIYYSKVAGELAKYVWLKEGLSPPSAAEIQKTFTTDLKALYARLLQDSKDPAKLVAYTKGFKSDDYIKGGAIAIQLLGIFALGEIIGRRHVYGYKDHSHAH